MKSTLHVKNFGPIKDAKLELSNVNVLIGPQGSGKSCLAKLFTILKSPSLYLDFDDEEVVSKFSVNKDKFYEELELYSIKEFLTKDTFLSFVCETHSVVFSQGKLDFADGLNYIDDLVWAIEGEDEDKVQKGIDELFEKSMSFGLNLLMRHFLKDRDYDIGDIEGKVKEEFMAFLEDTNEFELTEDELENLLSDSLEFKKRVFTNSTIYVPAERNLLNIIKNSALNLLRNNAPIPKYLLEAGAKYETAMEGIARLSLDFLGDGVEYRYVDKEARIFISENESILLANSSSGVQSALPIMAILYGSEAGEINKSKQLSFVIEEPESNLFPHTQYEILKVIEQVRTEDMGKIDIGTMHTYTTHSPYILSSLNNMLYAYIVSKNIKEEVFKELNNIVPVDNWINPNLFSAYQIVDGCAYSIQDEETGLIDETIIDNVSDDIMNDFKKIALLAAEND